MLPLVTSFLPGKIPRRMPGSETARFLPPPWKVAGRAPAVLGWEQADGEAILVDAGRNEWNAGHVNAIAPSDRLDLLVGAHTGGVWLLAAKGEAAPSAGHAIDHIGFRPLNVDNAVATLKTKNVKVTNEPRPLTLPSGVSMRLAFIEGIDGVRIELVQRN